MKPETEAIAERLRDAATRHGLYGRGQADITPESNPQHHTVGREFLGIKGRRWFCESKDRAGCWLYATDGSGLWIHVEDRLFPHVFFRINVDWRDTTTPKLHSRGGNVPPYVAGRNPDEEFGKLYPIPEEIARV